MDKCEIDKKLKQLERENNAIANYLFKKVKPIVDEWESAKEMSEEIMYV